MFQQIGFCACAAPVVPRKPASYCSRTKSSDWERLSHHQLPWVFSLSAWCCSLFWGVVSLQVRFLNMLGVVCGHWYFASFVLVGFDAGRVSGWQLYKTFQICYCYITQITVSQVYSHFPSQLISTWKLAQNHQLDFRPSASMLRKPEVDSSLETPHAPQTVHALCSCVHREGLAMARVILTPTPKALSSSTSFEGPPWDYLRAFDGDLFPHFL